MDEHKARIFNAIVSFVQDLDGEFGKKYKPVALYNRLVSQTTRNDDVFVERHIAAFRNFFNANPNYIRDQQVNSDAGRITYNERIYLNLGKILAKTDAEAHKYIHRHLTTIYLLLNAGTKQAQDALETLKQSETSAADKLNLNLPDTTEGNFIKDALAEMTGHFENVNMDEANPMAMMSGIMQSGFFTKFMGDLQTKFSNGEMDIQSLMTTVTSVIGDATPQGGEEAAQMRQFINQSMTAFSAMGVGGGGSGENGTPPNLGQLLGMFGGMNLGGNGAGSNSTNQLSIESPNSQSAAQSASQSAAQSASQSASQSPDTD